MSEDVYRPCPCGSGKKLKFCCSAIVGEMAKVAKFQESQQYRLGLQVLNGFDQAYQHNAWVMTTRATLLLNDDRADEAREVLKQLLEIAPDHLFAIGLYATVAIATQSYERARPAVQRAFQRCARVYPDLVSGVAMGVAAAMLAANKYMAARQHLALAMRLAPTQNRQNVFLRLLEFEGNVEIPYPLRSVHMISAYKGDDTSAQEAQRARVLAEIGCWHHAAREYAGLAEKRPDDAVLWKNAGLCRAWDGDEQAASKALHRAARVSSDFAEAVELETIAQLLENNSPSNCVSMVTLEFPVKSTSRLLTSLDTAGPLLRIEVPPPAEGDPSEPPAAAYIVPDRLLEPDVSPETLTLETMPNVMAQVIVVDGNPEAGRMSHAYVSGLAGKEIEAAREAFLTAAGDEIELPATQSEERLLLPRDFYPMYWRWQWPENAPLTVRRRLQLAQWCRVVHEVWPQQSLSSLSGKSPREAVGVSELKVPLTAAMYVLDAYCEQNRHPIDLAGLADKLGIELPPPVEVADSTSVQSFSSMQLTRLRVGKLNDAQLLSAMTRADLIRHGRFLLEVLTEVLQRPQCQAKVDLNHVYRTLSDLCRDQDRISEALDWADKGREAIKGDKDAFKQILEWDMRELVLRLQQSDEEALKLFVRQLLEYYSPKLPNFEAYLLDVLEQYGFETSRLGSESVTMAETDAGGAQAGGIWTPQGQRQAESSPSKLWLPGQD